MLQIMGAFASYIEVPEAHLQDHSAIPSLENDSSDSRSQNVRIHSAKERPATAFASVQYRDHWFWIEDADLRTKRAITTIMFCFTLADTGNNDKLPLITIPAQ